MRAAGFDVRSDNRTGNTVGHLIWCLHLITCPSSADVAYFLGVCAGFLQVHGFFFSLNELQRHKQSAVFCFFFYLKLITTSSTLFEHCSYTSKEKSAGIKLRVKTIWSVPRLPGRFETPPSCDPWWQLTNATILDSCATCSVLLLHFNIALFVPLVHNTTLRQAHCAARTT